MSAKLSSSPSIQNLPMATLIDVAKETWERTEVEADVAKADMRKAKKIFKRAKKAAKKARRAFEALVSEAKTVGRAPKSKANKPVAKEKVASPKTATSRLDDAAANA